MIWVQEDFGRGISSFVGKANFDLVRDDQLLWLEDDSSLFNIKSTYLALLNWNRWDWYIQIDVANSNSVESVFFVVENIIR